MSHNQSPYPHYNAYAAHNHHSPTPAEQYTHSTSPYAAAALPAGGTSPYAFNYDATDTTATPAHPAAASEYAPYAAHHTSSPYPFNYHTTSYTPHTTPSLTAPSYTPHTTPSLTAQAPYQLPHHNHNSVSALTQQFHSLHVAPARSFLASASSLDIPHTTPLPSLSYRYDTYFNQLPLMKRELQHCERVSICMYRVTNNEPRKQDRRERGTAIEEAVEGSASSSSRERSKSSTDSSSGGGVVNKDRAASSSVNNSSSTTNSSSSNSGNTSSVTSISSATSTTPISAPSTPYTAFIQFILHPSPTDTSELSLHLPGGDCDEQTEKEKGPVFTALRHFNHQLFQRKIVDTGFFVNIRNRLMTKPILYQTAKKQATFCIELPKPQTAYIADNFATAQETAAKATAEAAEKKQAAVIAEQHVHMAVEQLQWVQEDEPPSVPVAQAIVWCDYNELESVLKGPKANYTVRCTDGTEYSVSRAVVEFFRLPEIKQLFDNICFTGRELSRKQLRSLEDTRKLETKAMQMAAPTDSWQVGKEIGEADVHEDESVARPVAPQRSDQRYQKPEATAPLRRNQRASQQQQSRGKHAARQQYTPEGGIWQRPRTAATSHSNNISTATRRFYFDARSANDAVVSAELSACTLSTPTPATHSAPSTSPSTSNSASALQRQTPNTPRTPVKPYSYVARALTAADQLSYRAAGVCCYRLLPTTHTTQANGSDNSSNRLGATRYTLQLLLGLETSKHNAGHLSLLGGKIDKVDGKLAVNTAVREVCEETGDCCSDPSFRSSLHASCTAGPVLYRSAAKYALFFHDMSKVQAQQALPQAYDTWKETEPQGSVEMAGLYWVNFSDLVATVSHHARTASVRCADGSEHPLYWPFAVDTFRCRELQQLLKQLQHTGQMPVISDQRTSPRSSRKSPRLLSSTPAASTVAKL